LPVICSIRWTAFLRNATHLIRDHDPLFTTAWTTLLKSCAVESVPIPPRSPNGNPHAERFVRTVRSECLDHFVIFGERHLRHLLREFVAHYFVAHYMRSATAKPSVANSSDEIQRRRTTMRCRTRFGAARALAGCSISTFVLPLETRRRVSGHYGVRRSFTVGFGTSSPRCVVGCWTGFRRARAVVFFAFFAIAVSLAR
jgi:hypothetical protein